MQLSPVGVDVHALATGGRGRLAREARGVGGLVCMPFPNSPLMASIANGTPVEASIPRNPPYCGARHRVQRPDQQGSRLVVSSVLGEVR